MYFMRTRQRGAAGAWILGVVVLLILAFVAWRWFMYSPQHETQVDEPVAAATTPVAASTAEQYPVSAIATSSPAPASSVALEAQDESTVVDSLAALPGGQSLAGLFNRPDVIQRIVATVDALPGKQLSRKILPMKLPDGSFKVAEAHGSTVISADNSARYAPYLKAVEQVDTPVLVRWYVRHYPMFEQAYRQLGYPGGHFNDRLVAVIDNLLATPEMKTAPVLVPYKGGWAYANRNLETLSAGQKMLLRLTPSEQARLRTRLREVRAALTGAQLPAAAGSAG